MATPLAIFLQQPGRVDLLIDGRLASSRIYPAGNLVKLNTGEVAVVVTVHASDPHRPHVRVLFNRALERLATPYDLNLWELQGEEGMPSSVAMPLDPAEFQIHPLALL